MILDIGSLMFGMDTRTPGGNPSWGTDMGQNNEYKFSFEDIGSFIVGMVYSQVHDFDINDCPLGKGGKQQDRYTLELASFFKKIFVNDLLVENANFILIVVKQILSNSGNHIGRKTLKYGPHIKYHGIYYNEDCFKKIETKLGIKNGAAWFVYKIEIKNQDELHFNVLIGDPNKALEFNDVWSRKEYVKTLLSNERKLNQIEYIKFKNLISWFFNQSKINNGIMEGKKLQYSGHEEGSPIREFYKEWREYNGFTLDCNLQAGKKDGGPSKWSTSKRNYINYRYINIRPNFTDDGQIDYFYLDVYNSDDWIDKIEKKYGPNKYYVVYLDLNNDNEPNEELKRLFDNYKNLVQDVLNDSENTGFVENNLIEYFDFFSSLIGEGQNLIVYGTPGCGKSYYVQHTLLNDYKQDNIIRITFFQDYTNTDFVGQILPIVDGDKVTYKFNPGPFTLALERAIRYPSEKIALVIEELNRGSAASIFGDIFQLLDRKNGVSEYSITNVNIIDYLKKQFKGVYTFKDIRIPGNLSIFATMNTSDQNVFTLDTAFKRRWKFKKLINKFETTHKFKNKFIPGPTGKADVTWEEVVNAINEYILEVSDGLNSEDKQIGVYFIDEKGMREEKVDTSTPEEIEHFAYKVFEYLWDDVAKFSRPDWFGKEIKSLDQLVEEYKKNGIEVFNDDIFKKK